MFKISKSKIVLLNIQFFFLETEPLENKIDRYKRLIEEILSRNILYYWEGFILLFSIRFRINQYYLKRYVSRGIYVSES